MAAKKGSSGKGKGKGGAKKPVTRSPLRVVSDLGPDLHLDLGAESDGIPPESPDANLRIVAPPGTNMPRGVPGLAFRSPLLPPFPEAGEEIMFDLQQLIHSRPLGSIDELNREIRKLTMSGPVPRSEPAEPRSKAQRLMYDAWSGDPEEGMALAEKALTIDPDCTDAYLFLAFHHGDDQGETFGLIKEAIDAGERHLEAEGTLNDPEITSLWGHLPSRPYLRARAFLARMLWGLGGRITATAIADRSLELDRDDALGMRYLLLSWYLDMGEEWLARDLLDEYKDDPSAFWSYADALLTFLDRGDDRTSKARLNKALKANESVADLLLDEPPDPLEGLIVDSYSPGGEDEATICALPLFAGWDRHEDAIDWLMDGLERKRKRDAKKPRQ